VNDNAFEWDDAKAAENWRHHGTAGACELSRLGKQRDMTKTPIIAKMLPGGSVAEVLAEGRERRLPDIPMRPMTPEAVEEGAGRS
jgi:hypothetical protein